VMTLRRVFELFWTIRSISHFCFGTILKRDHFATSIAANIRQSTRFSSVHNAIINQRIWTFSHPRLRLASRPVKGRLGRLPGSNSPTKINGSKRTSSRGQPCGHIVPVAVARSRIRTICCSSGDELNLFRKRRITAKPIGATGR
jgi:hypothetical protein